MVDDDTRWQRVEDKVDGLTNRLSSIAASMGSIEQKIDYGDRTAMALVEATKQLLNAAIVTVGRETDRAHARLDAAEKRGMDNTRLIVGSFLFPIIAAVIVFALGVAH